jgi:catechol 2,3-dioxygenase-like lactoylglutathione lyase family enzyme
MTKILISFQYSFSRTKQLTMLSDKTLKAFIPATDAGKAKAFYRDILGLELLSEDEYGMDFDANASLFRISIVRQYNPQPFTIMGWNVPDIFSIIRLLNQRGIYCEIYPSLNQDKSGVWISPAETKVAWFKDPEGNILSVSEHP